jgi:hypothetical protein
MDDILRKYFHSSAYTDPVSQQNDIKYIRQCSRTGRRNNQMLMEISDVKVTITGDTYWTPNIIYQIKGKHGAAQISTSPHIVSNLYMAYTK